MHLERHRLDELMAAIERAPEPDNHKCFALLVAPLVLFVRVEHDFTVYYSVVKYPKQDKQLIHVYAIKETTGSVRDMLSSPFH